MHARGLHARPQAVVATASYGPCVRLHSVEDGTPVAVLDHAAPAVAVQFSPDGALLAVALENHMVRSCGGVITESPPSAWPWRNTLGEGLAGDALCV